MIQQGRPFSFVSKFVLFIYRREIRITRWLAFVISSSLIGRYPKERLNEDWSTEERILVVSLFPEFKYVETRTQGNMNILLNLRSRHR